MTYPTGNYGGGVPQMGFPPVTPVVKHLMIINAIVYVATFALSWSDTLTMWTFRVLGADPGTWSSWFPFVPIWQLVTAGFLHDLRDIFHLLMNMLGLYFFGTMLEGILGSRRFAVAYLSMVVAGFALHILVEFADDTSIRAVGASGGVFGVLLACAVLRPDAGVYLFPLPIQIKLKWIAIFFVVIMVFQMLVNQRDGISDRTAHWVHFGGALYGGVAAWRKWLWADPVRKVEAKRAERQVAQRQADEVQLDQLLVKIQREGIQSLTKRERDFLKKTSSRKG